MVDFTAKLARLLREEAGSPSLRLLGVSWLMSGWPVGTGVRTRALLFRAAGLRIGRGTLIAGPIGFGMSGNPHRTITIGSGCFLNSPLFLDAAGPVVIGDHVSLGHHVTVITSGHALGPPESRAGDLQVAPVTIENGAWVAAGVTLLPGVTVGQGAVVAAGAVVTKDVPPHTLAGGIPAKFIKTLPTGE